MESINRVDGELTWLVQSKVDMNMESIDRINGAPIRTAHSKRDGVVNVE